MTTNEHLYATVSVKKIHKSSIYGYFARLHYITQVLFLLCPSPADSWHSTERLIYIVVGP